MVENAKKMEAVEITDDNHAAANRKAENNEEHFVEEMVENAESGEKIEAIETLKLSVSSDDTKESKVEKENETITTPEEETIGTSDGNYQIKIEEKVNDITETEDSDDESKGY